MPNTRDASQGGLAEADEIYGDLARTDAAAGAATRSAAPMVGLQQTAMRFAIVFLVAYGSILLTRGEHATSPLWPANAVLLVLLLRSPCSKSRWLDLVGAAAGAMVLANWLNGTSIPLSIWFTVANSAEVAAAFLIIRFGHTMRAERSRPAFRQLLRLLSAALFAPLLSAVIAGAALHLTSGGSFGENFLRWYLAAALGMLMILPLGVMDYREAFQRLCTPEGLRSALLTLGFVAISTTVIFLQTVSPFIFLVTAAVLFAAYRHRALGAATVIVVAMIAVPLTAAGRGPLSLIVAQDEMGRQFLLQAYLMALGFVAVVAAAILDDRDGLRLMAERQAAEARQKAEAQSALLRQLAHEIRTPLNVIQGYAAILRENIVLDAETRRMAEAIVDASSEAQTLANGILDQARVERGALRLSPAQHRVDDIFAELRTEFQKATPATRLVFDETNQHLIFGDRMRIKQMLRNLINNALNYAGEFGPIYISAAPDDTHGYTRLEVVDRGPGIAKNRLHEVFEPFSTLGPPSSSGKSAGYGLSLVKQLAEAQHGAIGVFSTPYVETRFWIALPTAPTKDILEWYNRAAPDIDPRSIFPD
jgi:signal transduction histidine kinase